MAKAVAAKRDRCETFESISKSLALAAVPIFVALAGLGGYVVNGHFEQQKLAVEREKDQQQVALEREKLKQDMFKRAIDVVFNDKDSGKMFGREMSVEERRYYHQHWFDTYNQYADVKISDELIAVVMEQDAVAAGAQDARRAGSEASDHWVAVGTFGTSHAGLSFDVKVPKGYTGMLKKNLIIQARWSVPIRENTDQPGPRTREIGWMAWGQCARVVDYDNFVRGQAWAKIEVVKCPPETPDHLANSASKEGSS
jgi:hypothetical protein